MPELPEVETVRRGLSPVMEGAVFTRVEQRRPNLRFPFPEGFASRLTGARLERFDRRGKYLVAVLSTDEALIMHLGMSGRFTVMPADRAARGAQPKDGPALALFHYEMPGNPAHDHVVFHMAGPAGRVHVTYNDPRRFGFMDLVAGDDLDQSQHFAKMGPEPLSNQFSPAAFSEALRGKTTTIKAALLDQRVVAGVGNIYACEALFRAGISPRRQAKTVAGRRADRLRSAVVDVLREAIEAGGSSLRDFRNAEGALGYFQHRFQVYDRAGAPCPACGAEVKRVVQSARSTFYCGRCQR